MLKKVISFTLLAIGFVLTGCSNNNANDQTDSFVSTDTTGNQDAVEHHDANHPATDNRISDAKPEDNSPSTDTVCQAKTCQDLGWACGEGDNGCGDVLQCGQCPKGTYCGADHKCGTKPRFCGNNTCNEDENCGNCPEDCACGGGQVCFNDHCCPPESCRVLEWECGKGDNGCGGTVDCGNCDAEHTCIKHKCKMKPKCGDGKCNGNENCGTCKADCACRNVEICENGKCKDLDSDHEWVDHNTGLMWEATPMSKHIKWDEADAYCKALELDGYTGWRIPTIDELRTLIRGCQHTVVGGDCKVSVSCASDTCGDTDACREACLEGEGPGDNDCYWPVVWIKGTCNNGGFWSSTLDTSQAATVWEVRFNTGAIRSESKNWKDYVRCVRNGE